MMGAMDAPRDAQGFLTAESVRGLFDRAVAHWNARRFFEAHEDWETLWNDAEGRYREWLQGLIQFAAGFHHFQRGGSGGFARLMKTASDKAAGYTGDTQGVDFCGLWAELRPWVAHGERVSHGEDLRHGAPAALPTIEYQPGFVPVPFPPEPDSEDAEDEA